MTMSKESTERLGRVSSVDIAPILHRISPRKLRKRLFPKTETRCSTRPGESCPLRKTKRAKTTRGTVKNQKSKSKALSAKLLTHSENRQSEHSSDNHQYSSPPGRCITTDTVSTNTTDVIAETDSTRETDSTSDNLIIMSPKTPQQKEKTQLARQKQLEDMKVREAAFAREERLLKRKGLWTTPVKKQTGKKITWNADNPIVFNYQQV